MRGHLDVRNVDDSVRHLSVWLEWRTTDAAPVSGKTDAVIVELAGRTIGGRANPSFTLKLPREPLTYGGHLFSIVWFVVVSADVAWARDPSFEVAIEVGPSPHALPDKPLLVTLDASNSGVKPGLGALVKSVTGIGLGSAFAGVAMSTTAALVVGVGGLGLYALARRGHSRLTRLLGHPALVIAPGSPTIGQPFELRLTLKPTATLTSVIATWELTGTELLTTGHGSNARTQTEQRFGTHGAFGRVSNASPGRELLLTSKADLASKRLPTFEAERHEVRWLLTVSINAKPEGRLAFTDDHFVVLSVRA